MHLFPVPARAEDITGTYPTLLERALERALRSRFWGRRLITAGVTPENIGRYARDEGLWRTLPLTTKEDLRSIAPEHFYDEINIAPETSIAEYWRSGGSTGQPLFYPRTYADLQAALEGFRRVFELAGVVKGDLGHFSFPLGVHPVGQCMVRSAQNHGAAALWVGAGNNTPSGAQIELLERLRPTFWTGMGSYGLHLANLAEAMGVDLSRGRIRRVITCAEMLSVTKRRKLAAKWGGEVRDSFGMSEMGMMSGECDQGQGAMHLWTDQFYCEVLHPDTWEPVAEGDEGVLVVTPLVTNEATPFVRWVSGDIVIMTKGCACGSPFRVFPLLRHAHRTAGFFKVKGVNVNHTELEDLLLGTPGVADFRVTLYTAVDGRECMRLELEAGAGNSAEALAAAVRASVHHSYGIVVDIHHLEQGSLAREFDQMVKANRFLDERE